MPIEKLISNDGKNFKKDIQNQAKSDLGITKSDVSGPNNSNTPWKIPDESSVFWNPLDIKPERWNQLYPYRLLVVDISSGLPKIVGGKPDTKGSVNTSTTKEQGIEYVITQTAIPGTWQAILPITPQQLKISDSFAINTSATMRGIVEEHNGVKFKMISAAGTTGIWPRKPTKEGSITSPQVHESIFGGTIQAATNVANSAANLGKTLNNLKTTVTNMFSKKESKETQETPKSSGAEFSTGYYQALYLGQFFERYAEAKKNPENKNWRLVFDIPKQNQSFIVTPISFELSQSERKPNEMIYSFQLKAWKRIELNKDDSLKNLNSVLPKLEPNIYQQMVTSIRQVRNVLGNSINLIKAVRSDYLGVFNNLRQAQFAIKDAAGLALAISDLPRQFTMDTESIWKNNVAGKNALAGSLNGIGDIGRGINQNNPISGKLTSQSQKTTQVTGSIVDRQNTNEGLSDEEVRAGAIGSAAAIRLSTDPISKISSNPEEYFDFFDNITISDLRLRPAHLDAIEKEKELISLLTIDDFRKFKSELISLSNDIADNFGAGDTTYSDIYRIPSPKSRAIDMTLEENEVLIALFEAIQVLDTLTSSKQYDDRNIENPLEFVGGLANESGIDFQQFSSKMLVPVPFGLTIEEIAARYMGDTARWLEIATLNSLRSPYIDEDGFIYNLLSNAEGRQFSVDDTEDNLYVGQKIVISSNAVPQTSRKIVNIEKIGDGNYLVTVDGLDDLDVFQTSDNAKIQGYLPGTVNSQNQIYLPVNLPAQEDDRAFDIINIPNTNINKLAKIDFLLDDNYDIAINNIGDFRLATGLNNLIQALKLKIITQRGTLLQHLDYGLGLTHGVSISDIENGEIIKSLNKMIEEDNRFEAIDNIEIRLNGPTLSIYMSVKIANGNGVIPISFDIKAS